MIKSLSSEVSRVMWVFSLSFLSEEILRLFWINMSFPDLR